EHAVEVAGAGGALQAFPHGAGADPDLGSAARVDLLHRGGEHDVGSRLLGQLRVRVQSAGVAVEVLALPELQRVDEDGDDDLAVGSRYPARGADQRGVALVQGAHGHHDGAAARARAGVQFPGGAQQGGGHRRAPFRGACRAVRDEWALGYGAGPTTPAADSWAWAVRPVTWAVRPVRAGAEARVTAAAVAPVAVVAAVAAVAGVVAVAAEVGR